MGTRLANFRHHPHSDLHCVRCLMRGLSLAFHSKASRSCCCLSLYFSSLSPVVLTRVGCEDSAAEHACPRLCQRGHRLDNFTSPFLLHNPPSSASGLPGNTPHHKLPCFRPNLRGGSQKGDPSTDGRFHSRRQRPAPARRRTGGPRGTPR